MALFLLCGRLHLSKMAVKMSPIPDARLQCGLTIPPSRSRVHVPLLKSEQGYVTHAYNL